MSASVDKANQLAAHREQHMAVMQQKLQTAYAALNDLPDEQRVPAQEALLAVWRKNLAIADLVQQAERHLAESDATQHATVSTLLQITQQRNQILGELDSMTHALVNVYSGSHPLVRQFAETIMEDHNAAFWESLPYDFANMLGEEWSHMDADALYAALTIDLDEKEEGRGDYGYTREELIIFRKKVLASIRQLRGNS